MGPRQRGQGLTRAWLMLISGGILALTLLALIVIGGYTQRGWEWTGLTRDVTFWDWLKVLVVPITVGGAVPALNWLQKRRELDIEDQRGQDAALEAYLGQVSELLSAKGRPLHRARPGDELSMVARARTLTILTRLDGARKGSVVRFLYESGLIDDKAGPVISLKDADLRGAALEWAILSDANLSGAHLEEAVLEGTNLARVNLGGSYLSKARFTSARLTGAYLRGALVTNAVLVGADLTKAYLRWARFEKADMEGAYLNGANLTGANLSEANLSNAHLKRADLNGANLSKADLSRADLSGAKVVTKKQLNACRSLAGATLPDGSKHP